MLLCMPTWVPTVVPPRTTPGVLTLAGLAWELSSVLTSRLHSGPALVLVSTLVPPCTTTGVLAPSVLACELSSALPSRLHSGPALTLVSVLRAGLVLVAP